MSDEREMSICSVCGARAIVMSTDPITVEFREGTYFVDGFEYEHCTVCGEDIFDAGQGDAIDAKAAAMARADLGLLTPDEIRQLRFDLDLTQAALERALGASDGTVVRWERGVVFQNRTADVLMRLLWAHPELVLEARGVVAREGRGPYRKGR